MLSRLVIARVAPRAILGSRCSSSVGNPGCPPGREILTGVEEGPERDLVNFPRLKRPLYPGKVRSVTAGTMFPQIHLRIKLTVEKGTYVLHYP